jgi:hypothetical protein
VSELLIFGCINPSDQKECRWAHRYLAKKGLLSGNPMSTTVIEQLRHLDSQARVTGELRRLFESALNRYRSREKEKNLGRKNYNFFISKKAASQLAKLQNELGAGTNVAEAIEYLVEQAHQDIRWAKTKTLKQAQITKQTIFSPGNSHHLQDKHIKTLESALRLRDNIINEHIDRIADLKARIETWGFAEEPPAPNHSLRKSELIQALTRETEEALTPATTSET